MTPAPFIFSSGNAARTVDRLAWLVLAVVTLIAVLTFRDYGLGWDDYAHSEYGELLLAYYGSGFRDQRALSFKPSCTTPAEI